MDINIAEKTVFIDESGNNGFDFTKDSVSTHYVITAIVIDTENVETVRLEAESIRQKYFPNGELKSSHCKDKGKRFKILSDLVKLDFKTVSVIINKKHIYDNSPIKNFEDTFYKYLNKLLFIELKFFNCDLAIFADKHGNEEFMESFSEYIKKEFPRNLIDHNSFDFIDSKNEVLIQVADFIAGTLSFGYEESKVCEEYKGFYSLLSAKKPIIRLWPSETISENLDIIDSDKYDREIAKTCIKLASDYIDDNQASDNELVIDQLVTLKYLLNQLYLYPNDYIYIDELINLINVQSNRKYIRRFFQRNIIAHMRDSGVIISGSNQGVKIPITSKELYEHTEHILGQAIPMLDRLEKARRRILLITNNELDIVDNDKYKRIVDYLDNK